MTDECRCGRPTRDGADVCDTCADTFARALGDVPWIDEQIEITMSGQRALPTEGAARGTETPLPWNEAAGDARRTLHGLLVTWVRFCEEERVPHQSPKDGLPDDNLPALSRWLLWRVDGLARRDIGAEAVDEITNAVAACHRVIDRRPDRWFAGACNAITELGGECGESMYAISTSGNVKCHRCGALHDIGARRDWLLSEAEDHLADAVTISRAISWLGAERLSAALVRKWAERGRIVAKGHTPGGRPLYRIGDIMDLMARKVG